MDAPETRDDTDALIDALHTQMVNGDLVLPAEIVVNGVRYDPGRYQLTYVGPVHSTTLEEMKRELGMD